MEVPKEPNEVIAKTENNRIWKVCTNEPKLNFKHASASDCNILCAKQALTSTSYKNHLPYPLSQNPKHFLKDTVHDLVNKKRTFQLSVDDVTKTFRRSQRQLNVSKQFQCYEDMQRVLDTEPDQFFSSNYNWYYTGGNLQFQCVDELNLLFHVLNGKLAVARVKQKPTHWKVNKKETISEEFENDIFQLDSLHKNNVLIVSAREKHKIHLHQISLQDDINSSEIDTKTNKIPFVGHSINKHEANEYATIDANQELNIWDIETKRQKQSHKIEVNYDDFDGDYFAQISYRNNDTLAYINRTELHLFDVRTNCKTSLFLKGRDLLLPIDRFTNICPNAEYDSNFFISSFKDILEMDIRALTPVNKWGHIFDNAPLLSELRTINGQNVCCVSSASPTEKLLIVNSNLPDYLPSCVRSLETSILSNPYLNKQDEILSRLNFSTTGLQLHHTTDGQTVLFSVNSAGDLFSQNVKCEDTANNVETLNKKFQKWNDSIMDWCKEPDNFETITVVDKVVMRDMKLNCNEQKTPDEWLKKERIKSVVLNLKRTKKGTNRKITNIWFGVDHDDLDDMEEIEPHANVTNWLNQTSLITPENNAL